MALTFSQGRQSGQAPIRSRYANLDYTASKAAKPFTDQVAAQKKELDDKVEAFRKARKEMEDVSDTSMWGEHADILKKKAEVLASEETMDRYMDTKDGMFKYEQLVSQLNEEITLAEEAYKNQKGTSADPATAATLEAANIRGLTPNINPYSDKGFKPGLTPEEAKAIAEDMNKPKASVMRLNEDGEWEWNVDSGEEFGPKIQKGNIVVRENPFDPKLEEMDISGFTFFRNRDDGKFDDFQEVESFIRNQVKDNPEFAQMALRHYENENTNLEPGAVESAMETYLPRAVDMWVDEARDAFNKGTSAKPTEGDKRRADERAKAIKDRDLFFQSISVEENVQDIRKDTDNPTIKAMGEASLADDGKIKVGERTTRTINVPLAGIKGSVAMKSGDQTGQMMPQSITRLPNGIYVVRGAFSAVDKNTSIAKDVDTVDVRLNPNDLSDMSALNQIFVLANSQLAGGNLDVSLQEIFEDPTAFDVRVTQGSGFSSNDIN